MQLLLVCRKCCPNEAPPGGVRVTNSRTIFFIFTNSRTKNKVFTNSRTVISDFHEPSAKSLFFILIIFSCDEFLQAECLCFLYPCISVTMSLVMDCYTEYSSPWLGTQIIEIITRCNIIFTFVIDTGWARKKGAKFNF